MDPGGKSPPRSGHTHTNMYKKQLGKFGEVLINLSWQIVSGPVIFLVPVLRRCHIGRFVVLLAVLLVLLFGTQTEEQRVDAIADVRHRYCGKSIISDGDGEGSNRICENSPAGSRIRTIGNSSGSSTMNQNSSDMPLLIRYGSNRLRLRCCNKICDKGQKQQQQ